MPRSDREDSASLEALLASGGESGDFLDQLVSAANEQLGMDLAYMVEFVENNEVFRKLAGDKRSFGFEEEMAIPLAESYCQRLVQGDLPSIVANTTDEQIVRDLPITQQELEDPTDRWALAAPQSGRGKFDLCPGVPE